MGVKSCGIYYRVSTDRQDIASQQLAVEQWLAGLPEALQPKRVETFTDEGISGKTMQRPQFNKMLDAAYAGKLDTIVVYRLDRFSRDATSAIRLILSLDEVGVGFISVTQPVLNLGHENPFRRTMLAAFAEIAQLERETIVARVKSGLDAARKRGTILGPPRTITPEKEADVRRLRTEGRSIREIARDVGISVGAVAKIVKPG